MARLLIELRTQQDTLQEMQYHKQVQGFIYSLTGNSGNSAYDDLHDSKSKFFSYSSLFPHTHYMQQGSIKTLIISSPDHHFIAYLHDILSVNTEKVIEIGYMKFKISYMKKLYPQVPNHNCTTGLITGTPIIIRISNLDYKKYGYQSIYNNFTYWKNGHPPSVFIQELQNKLICRYAKYKSHNLIEYQKYLDKYKGMKIFDIFKFKRDMSTRAVVDNYEQIIIASVWEFIFNNVNDGKRELIQFALDSGLGERNSLGFGFMNRIG